MALAYYRTPLDLACQLDDPGCFGLKAMITDSEDRRERASRRAAAGLSIARLVARGLLEHCARGRWRLTPAGVELAAALHPEVQPLSERELKRRLAQDASLREALSGLRKRTRRRERGTARGSSRAGRTSQRMSRSIKVLTKR
jgi:hypothetical protein